MEREYTTYEMLYATHVIEKKRTIESVPASIRETVREIVDNAITEKKEEGAE